MNFVFTFPLQAQVNVRYTRWVYAGVVSLTRGTREAKEDFFLIFVFIGEFNA